MKERNEFQVVEGLHHGGDPDVLRSMRLLRGRVLVEVEPEVNKGRIVTIEQHGRAGDVGRTGKPHIGRVLAIGPPALTPVGRDGRGGAEVLPGFTVGERVMFVYAIALEKVRSFEGRLAVVSQEEVTAVVTDG